MVTRPDGYSLKGKPNLLADHWQLEVQTVTSSDLIYGSQRAWRRDRRWLKTTIGTVRKEGPDHPVEYMLERGTTWAVADSAQDAINRICTIHRMRVKG